MTRTRGLASKSTSILRRAATAASALLALVFVSLPVLADWLAPDASYRDAQLLLRYATRDTAGHGNDPALLDTLATALLHLGRVPEARKLYERVLAARPGDKSASAGLGKLALWADRNEQAESLLTVAGDVEQAPADLYAARLRLQHWNAAADMSEALGDDGRRPLLERMAGLKPLEVKGDRAKVVLDRMWPAPLVRVRLNGASVLMMVDTGTPGVLIDRLAMTKNAVTPVDGQRLTAWTGTRVAVRNAIVQKLEIGGVIITNVPAGVLSLHKLSLEVNPQGAEIAGVIGMSVLRRFDTAFDFRRRTFELAPLGSTAKAGGLRVPFEMWGEDELTVWGSINGGRRLALTLATGLPGGGLGAPDVVFEEHGLKSGGVAKLVKGAGTWLQGRPWGQVNVPAISLGTVAFDHVSGWSGAMDPVEMWRHGVRRDGLLGPGILLKRRMTIDWTKRELVFDQD